MTAKSPLEPNPFKKSIYAPTGNPVARDVYASMGFALSEWEHAETLLGTMFMMLVRSDHSAFRAFGFLFASGNRRELILGAADAYFSMLPPGADKETAAILHKKIEAHMNLISDASRRRDEIAHGTVMGLEFDDQTKQWCYFLVPAFYASKKTEPLPPFKPSYRMSTKELDRYAELFGELLKRSTEINREISAFSQSLLEISRERPTLPRT